MNLLLILLFNVVVIGFVLDIVYLFKCVLPKTVTSYNLIYPDSTSYECLLLYDQSGKYPTLDGCLFGASRSYCMSPLTNECTKIIGPGCSPGQQLFRSEEACLAHTLPYKLSLTTTGTGYVCLEEVSGGYDTLHDCNVACQAIRRGAYCFSNSDNTCKPMIDSCPTNQLVYSDYYDCNEDGIKYGLVQADGEYACVLDSKSMMTYGQCVAKGTGLLNNKFCSADLGGGSNGCFSDALLDCVKYGSKTYANSDACIASACDTGKTCSDNNDMFACVPAPSSCGT